MKAGEKRTIHCLMDLVNQVVQVDLTARNKERVKLPAGKFDLLRIDTVMRLPGGGTMTGALWTDRGGEVLKNREDAMDMEVFRVPKEVALAETAPPTFDLSKDVLVKLEPAAARGPTRRGGSAIASSWRGAIRPRVFVSGPSQEVKSTGPHTAEITVWAIRPGRKRRQPQGGGRSAHGRRAAAEQLHPERRPQDRRRCQGSGRHGNRPLESGRGPGAVRASRRCSRDFNDAFSTAADVARARKGDCKEHAIYLAALARARGIPARVAIGMVYLNGAFGGHMWTEVYIDGRWIPLDATLGSGGIGAAHLKQGQSTLEGVSAYISLPARGAGRRPVEDRGAGGGVSGGGLRATGFASARLAPASEGTGGASGTRREVTKLPGCRSWRA